MRIPRKAAVALLAGVCIAGAAGASAASLGGSTAGLLGAENPSVTACDTTGVTIGYTTAYNSTTQKYEVTSVNFTNVDPACNGKPASVTLRGGTGTVIGSATSAGITVATNAFSMPISPGADANLIAGVSVVISG